MTRNNEIDQFDNNFYKWLEAHGVEAISLQGGQWNANIDLNVLKLAIMQLIEKHTAEKVLEGKIEQVEFLMENNALDSSYALGCIQALQAELSKLKEE